MFLTWRSAVTEEAVRRYCAPHYPSSKDMNIKELSNRTGPTCASSLSLRSINSTSSCNEVDDSGDVCSKSLRGSTNNIAKNKINKKKGGMTKSLSSSSCCVGFVETTTTTRKKLKGKKEYKHQQKHEHLIIDCEHSCDNKAKQERHSEERATARTTENKTFKRQMSVEEEERMAIHRKRLFSTLLGPTKTSVLWFKHKDYPDSLSELFELMADADFFQRQDEFDEDDDEEDESECQCQDCDDEHHQDEQRQLEGHESINHFNINKNQSIFRNKNHSPPCCRSLNAESQGATTHTTIGNDASWTVEDDHHNNDHRHRIEPALPATVELKPQNFAGDHDEEEDDDTHWEHLRQKQQDQQQKHQNKQSNVPTAVEQCQECVNTVVQGVGRVIRSEKATTALHTAVDWFKSTTASIRDLRESSNNLNNMNNTGTSAPKVN